MSRDCADGRRLFMVLSPRSLSYARFAIESLYRNCAERFSLWLITDSQEDAACLDSELKGSRKGHDSENRNLFIYGESDLANLEQAKFGKFRHIRSFRQGHPCWRKITDPILLSDGNEEMIILDPDLYFPNRFRFEPTPSSGVVLMWQRPSCLLPPEVVEAAIAANVALAHHTDIGVAQWRLPLDLEWLDWLIGRLGSSQLPRSMHVESIVWAALAMHIGGGHLDPSTWVCWHRSPLKRILLKLGVPGTSILKSESLAGVKCFHAGGEAKSWLADAHELNILDWGEDVIAVTDIKAYTELAPSQYHTLQRNRRWLRKLGYYSVFGNG